MSGRRLSHMKKSPSWRHVLQGLWLSLFPVFAFIAFAPVSSRLSRLGLLAAGSLIILGALIFSWKRRAIFFCLLTVLAVIAIFTLLPGRPTSTELRTRYIQNLHSHEGTRYLWGGESRRGIDCSGLPRRSLQDALFHEGVFKLNPALVRAAIDLWWNDTTAQSMGQGYAGRTFTVTTCPSLNELDHSVLEPGDMAVTKSGGHIMAYLGEHKWIEADPLAMKVLVFTVPEPKNSWFATPMKVVRWGFFNQHPTPHIPP